MGITHSTVVVVADDGTSPVGTNEWNDNHVITGNITFPADVLVTDDIYPTVDGGAQCGKFGAAFSRYAVSDGGDFFFAGGAATIGGYSSGTLDFNTFASTRMSIDSAGTSTFFPQGVASATVTNPVAITSVETDYGAISFNGATTYATMIGMEAGAVGDNGWYFNVPATTGRFLWTVGGANKLQLEETAFKPRDPALELGDGSNTWGNLWLTAGGGIFWIPGNAQIVNDATGNIAFSTGASLTERMRIDSNGLVVIEGVSAGTGSVGVGGFGGQLEIRTNPANYNALTVQGYSDTSDWPSIAFLKSRGSPSSRLPVYANDGLGSLDFYCDTGTADGVGARIVAYAEATATATSFPTRLTFDTTPTGFTFPVERLRIDSAGRTIIGGASALLDIQYIADRSILQVVGTAGAASIVQGAFHPGAGAANQVLAHSRHATIGSHTVLQVGDELGTLLFQGSDGTDFHSGGYITVTVDATASNNSMPSTMGFYTSAVGGADPTERMQINSRGLMRVTNGSFGRPVITTATSALTIAVGHNHVISNAGATCAVTLPTASDYPGRELYLKTIAAQSIISVAANVIPLAGGATASAIVAATAGKYAKLVSDGATGWHIMEAN